ncbi:selenocysteine-specific translation elongation factor [Candidatus Poriferisodalis sp.]|uniref:selenocysteine-specific translation elongation factor n=1 Tax=Candidatus Poriferisodalis sp. TaxID=3101277 RepID=UPI003B017059
MHIVGTAGHVDHGKSTLVRALTGTDPDRLAEEKARGLTIDLGFAFCTLPSGRQVSFVDVPGHIRFVKNMLAGVGAVDACLFVVAAPEGWKPQSAEHLAILELLGISHGVVVLSQIDLVDDELAELARLDIAEHVEGTFLEHAPVIATDAIDGTGLDELRSALDDLCAATPTAVDRDRPRLWIDRSFAATGAGRIVTGTLAGGPISTGDELRTAPGGRPARVRAIQTQSTAVERIGPGHRVALNLTGVDADDLGRGIALVRPDQWHHTRSIDVELAVLDGVRNDVTRRGAYALYLGSGEWPVRLRVLGPERIAPGQTGYARLHLPVALPLVMGDRFVLRDFGRGQTVGGGTVLDPDPQLRASVARPDARPERMVAERGWIEATQLERLTGERAQPVLGGWVAVPELVEALVDDLRDRIERAGPLGLDLAGLDERQRLALDTLDGITVEAGRALRADADDVLADHPVIAELAAAPFSPPAPSTASQRELLALAARGDLVHADGIWFAASAIEAAAEQIAGLLGAQPEGITVAEIREALGTTRKYALPLVGYLDRTGVTRRRGDLRIAGPRLPEVSD